MDGVGTTLRGALAAIPLVLLMTASDASTGQAAARPTGCSSPGQVYQANILVKHGDAPSEAKALFLVCQQNRFVKIVDSDGRSYDDLDDFRAHNHLFGEDDMIMVPRSFPAVDASQSPGFGPWVSGHTSTSQAWRWLPAGIVLVLVLGSGGGFAWLVTHRRKAPVGGATSTGAPGDGTPDGGEVP
ncbi:hypothetical protein [Actinomadura litoris]|uniref:Uncharacterized protein n=1 Tax=Actinomadura litoris TaxID=2678616 RepID=A0A7K1L131_9ACTN|nr:hypothetical protein [Actinomadura litoris]MUN38023.1 hypothetical protein [Actinomadura litoris]